MKGRNFLLIITSVLAVLSSCREEQMPQLYCSHDISASPDSLILADSDIAYIKSLFDSNHLSEANLQFYRLDSNLPGWHRVRCCQFIHNLKIFTNQLIFVFDEENKLSSVTGNYVSTLHLDSLPVSNIDDVIRKYIHAVKKDHHIPFEKQEITKNCFNYEFGYYDKNITRNKTRHNFTKAWKVTPEGFGFPVIYLEDKTLKTIYYDDGIKALN